MQVCLPADRRVVAVALRLTRIDTIYPLLWLIPAVAAWRPAAVSGSVAAQGHWAGKACSLAMSALSILVLVTARAFVNGGLRRLRLGPIPAGTPVNLS